MKNSSSGQLYLHCGECEWGWHDPSKVDDPTAKFLTLIEDFEAEPATWADIEEAGSAQFATHTAET